MFRFTKRKIAAWIILVVLGLSPLFLIGSGLAVVIPALEIFWLAGLAQAAGIQVTAGPGVDAFSLIPPNAVGISLVLVGFTISLAVQYALACVLVRVTSNGIKSNPAPDQPRPQHRIPKQRPIAEWTNDVKLCPYCSAAMPRDATVCPDCGRDWRTGSASRSSV